MGTSRTKIAKRRQSYTTARRAKILAAVAEVGISEVALKHGVPQTTISNWLNRDAKVAEETASPSASTSKRVVAKSYTPSARAEVLEHGAEHGATAAAEKFAARRNGGIPPAPPAWRWPRRSPRALRTRCRRDTLHATLITSGLHNSEKGPLGELSQVF